MPNQTGWVTVTPGRLHWDDYLRLWSDYVGKRALIVYLLYNQAPLCSRENEKWCYDYLTKVEAGIKMGLRYIQNLALENESLLVLNQNVYIVLLAWTSSFEILTIPPI